MPDEQRVSASDILKPQERISRSPRELSYNAQASSWPAVWVASVILALVGKWIFYAPTLPVPQPGADPAAVKSMLENYKTLQQIALEPFTTLFDSIVVKVLLPVFTSILGYIFGSLTDKKNES